MGELSVITTLVPTASIRVITAVIPETDQPTWLIFAPGVTFFEKLRTNCCCATSVNVIGYLLLGASTRNQKRLGIQANC